MQQSEFKKLLKSTQGLIYLLRQTCFPRQLEFIDDVSNRKVAYCSRRAAKTYSAVTQMIIACLSKPGMRCIFLSSTKIKASALLMGAWRDITAKIPMPATVTGLTIKFENGSFINGAGCDTTEKDVDRLRGEKWDIVVCDEVQHFTHDLNYLIEDVMRPQVIETRGKIVMLGTPNDIPNNYFQRVCDGREPGWSVHTWTWGDNPHVGEQFKEELAEDCQKNPDFKNTNRYKREYLGQWVTDETMLVYKYGDVNLNAAYPTGHRKGVSMGVDFGTNDPSAIVVTEWFEHDPTLYIVDAWEEREVDSIDVGKKIKHYMDEWACPASMVNCDKSALMAITTIKNRCGIQVNSLPQNKKIEMIEHFNNDLSRGLIKLCKNAHDVVYNTWSQHVWDAKEWEYKGKKAENTRTPNHASDACLYAWRMAKHFTATGMKMEDGRSSEERYWDNVRKKEQEMFDRIEKRFSEEDEFFPLMDDF